LGNRIWGKLGEPIPEKGVLTRKDCMRLSGRRSISVIMRYSWYGLGGAASPDGVTAGPAVGASWPSSSGEVADSVVDRPPATAAGEAAAAADPPTAGRVAVEAGLGWLTDGEGLPSADEVAGASRWSLCAWSTASLRAVATVPRPAEGLPVTPDRSSGSGVFCRRSPPAAFWMRPFSTPTLAPAEVTSKGTSRGAAVAACNRRWVG